MGRIRLGSQAPHHDGVLQGNSQIYEREGSSKGGTHSQDKGAGEAGRQAPNERHAVLPLWELRTRQGREAYCRLGARGRTATAAFGKGEKRNPKGSRSLEGHGQGKGQSHCRVERNRADLRGRAELDKTLLQWFLPAFEYPSDAPKDGFL